MISGPRLCRWVCRIAWLVPREQRAAWREEWLAELLGTDSQRWPPAHDVLRGALCDALLLRVGAPDEWARDAHAGVGVLVRHPAAAVASIWLLGAWLGVSVLLTALAHRVLARADASSLALERWILLVVTAVALLALSAAALRAVRGLLAALPRAENVRQRLTMSACVGGGGVVAGAWLLRVALARVAQTMISLPG